MMKYLILIICIIGAGALGYFGEGYLRPVKAAKSGSNATDKQNLLFNMPLGKFTMQIIQSRKVLHLVFDMDVYIMGAPAFQSLNGAEGRARLRDATVTAIAELAETDPSLAQPHDEETRQAELASQIVRKLYVSFPAVRTARLNSFHANVTARE
tara:strand:+ start:9590 stop:10051 length:462 start_codon:yes stop_codon:yes gene_type:complete